jgi:hypothetical protein
VVLNTITKHGQLVCLLLGREWSPTGIIKWDKLAFLMLVGKYSTSEDLEGIGHLESGSEDKLLHHPRKQMESILAATPQQI